MTPKAGTGGKQVKLFLVDGTPGGLTTAEITNWTGHVLRGRRSQLAELLARDEVNRSGVYVLLGDDADEVGGVRCYVGESDELAKRMRDHARSKDFWDRVVLITSKDANLTKAHVRYLEFRLVQLATRAGRVGIENSTEPSEPNLPEADRSDMEYFVSQLQIILPVLDVHAFRVRDQIADTPLDTPESPVFRLENRKLGVDATAQQIDGEFTVLAGSVIVAGVEVKDSYRESTTRSYTALKARHEQLVADGSITIEGSHGHVTRDIVFTSPSAAGAICLGRSCNGRDAWVSTVGTFGQWEARGVE